MPKKVKVDGQIVIVPDDASIEEIDALSQAAAASKAPDQGPVQPNRGIQLRDQLATEQDPAKRRAIQAELAGIAPKQTETDNPLVAGAKTFNDVSDRTTKAFLGALPKGTLHGLITAYPSVFKGVLGAGKLGLEAMQDPDAVTEKVWGAISKAPAAMKTMVSDAIMKAHEDPEGYGADLGNMVGNAAGSTAALAAAPTAVVRFPGVASKAANMIPGVRKVRTLGKIIDKVADVAGVGEEGAAAGEAAGTAAEAEAAAAPKQWTVEDMMKRDADLKAQGYTPRTKPTPNGGVRVTGYQSPEAAAAKAAQAAPAAEAAPVAAEAAAPEAAAAEEAPVSNGYTEQQMKAMNDQAAARDAASGQAAMKDTSLGQRFNDSGTILNDPSVFPAELRDQILGAADDPEWFKGPVHQIGSKAAAAAEEAAPEMSSYERMMAETQVPEDLSTAEGPAWMQEKPGAAGPSSAPAENTVASEFPETASKRRDEFVPHLSENDVDTLLQDPKMTLERFLAERQMRNQLYRTGGMTPGR